MIYRLFDLAVMRLVVLIAIAVAVIGCGSKEMGPKKTTAQTEVKTTTVTVAAAADLKYAMDEIVAQFEQLNPHIFVKKTYGSSGNFYAQMTNRAPFDIYFSADIEYPRKLIDQGLALSGSEFPYAVGQIVVWVRNESSLDVEKLGVKSLLDPSIRKLAIANPKHAPYGRAAEAALKYLSVYEQVESRLVLGENIVQTAQFVESGAADVGIIALSLAMAPALSDKGRYWTVPLDAYPTLEQGGVILDWVKDRKATESLKTFFRSNEGRGTLRRYGFLLPGE